MNLVATTTIEASPADVFQFFETMDENYERWHPDHLAFEWEAGGGLREGSEATFEERIGGKLQQKTVRFTAIEPDRYIEFKPTGRLVGWLMPHISFSIEPRPGGCELTQRIRVRTGPIGAWLNRREFDAVRQHMAEEGEHLKRLLEGRADDPQSEPG